MKKGWKIFWIVCAVLAGIGVVCCAASYALGVTVDDIAKQYPNGFGFVENNHHDESSSQTHHSGDGEVFSGIRSIDADIFACVVAVYADPSLADEVKVVASNVDEKLKLAYYQEDDELKIETVKKVRGLNGGETRVELYIPADYVFEEVSFDMISGELYIEDVEAAELVLDVGAGVAEIVNFHAMDADFDCGTGTLTAAGISDNEVNIDCGIGTVDYRTVGKETDYNYEISCGIGDITCGESSYSGIAEKKNVNNRAAKDMDIDCGIGSVTVEFADQL